MRIRFHDYLALCRVSNLPTVWTNVLAALVLSGAGWTARTYLLLALSISCFYSGGMCLNDLWDAPVDRAEKPWRPIPSGRVSVYVAAAAVVLFLAVGVGALLLAPHPAGTLAGIGLCFVIVAYDRYHKQQWWSVFVMAACRLLVFVVCGLALTGVLGEAVVLGGLVQFLYVLALSRVARHEGERGSPFAFPVVPALIAGVSMVDGAMMALVSSPIWLAAGAGGAGLTWTANRFVRGD